MIAENRAAEKGGFMARKKLIAGNWKMHLMSEEAHELASRIRNGLDPDLKHDVLIAPGFTGLRAVRKALEGSKIFLAAQNMNWEDEGAFTGDVSPLQVKDVGCTHVILGHSERRHVFGETDGMLNKKVKAALKHSLRAILCVGEKLEEREAQKTYRVLETQIAGAMKDVSEDGLSNIIIAYEPVWAIGTGKTATPAQAQDAHVFIRKRIASMYGEAPAEEMRILYGGSVKPGNIDELMAQPDLDGALVGGASLKAEDFNRIIHFQEVIA